MPPPTPAVASPLVSRMPTTYPLRRVQLPTTLLNENVSPGRITTPSVRALASRRLTTLLCWSAISSGESSRSSSEPCFLTRTGSSRRARCAGRPARAGGEPGGVAAGLVDAYGDGIEPRVSLGQPAAGQRTVEGVHAGGMRRRLGGLRRQQREMCTIRRPDLCLADFPVESCTPRTLSSAARRGPSEFETRCPTRVFRPPPPLIPRRHHSCVSQDPLEAPGQGPGAAVPHRRRRLPQEARRQGDRGDRQVPPQGGPVVHQRGLRPGPVLARRRRAAVRRGRQAAQDHR